MISMRTIRRFLRGRTDNGVVKLKSYRSAHHFTCHYNRQRRYRKHNRSHRHGWQGWYVKRYRTKVEGLFHRMRRVIRAEYIRKGRLAL